MFGFRPAKIVLHEHESEVKNGLCVTPADMERMTVGNRAVSAQALSQYVYNLGFDEPSDLPLAYRRGIDMNIAWEAQEQFKSKVRSMRSHKARKAAQEKADAAASAQVQPSNI